MPDIQKDMPLVRETFERWASDDGAWTKAIEKNSDGIYKLMSTQNYWQAWHAAWEAAHLESQGAKPCVVPMRSAEEWGSTIGRDPDFNFTGAYMLRLTGKDDVLGFEEFIKAVQQDALNSAGQRCVPDIQKLIDAFLGWKLPESVCSDPCVTDRNYNPRYGTNLLTAAEAQALFEYLFAVAAPPAPTPNDTEHRIEISGDAAMRLAQSIDADYVINRIGETQGKNRIGKIANLIRAYAASLGRKDGGE